MIEELVFTSAKRGLQIGKSGFCTVASTPGMAANLARLLESLSGYRHLHPPGSAEAKKNPVIYSHLKAVVGGRSVNVLSQIRDAGFDYSNRSNKLAHHLAIRDTKAQSLGPANVLTNPTHFISSWNQDPTKLDPRALSGENCQPKPCATWQSVTGDAGWAGDLIEAVQKRRQAYLIVNESTPSIQLIQEALALLPVQKQWGVTFSTFFTKLPPKIECNIRCVLSGSPEVAIAKRSQANFVLNLTQRCGRSASSLADFTRKGTLIQESVKPSAVGKPELAVAPDSKPTKVQKPKNKHSVRHDVEDDLEEYDLVEVPPKLRGGKQTKLGDPPAVKKQGSGVGKWIAIAGAILLLLGLSSLLFIPGVRNSITGIIELDQATAGTEDGVTSEKEKEASQDVTPSEKISKTKVGQKVTESQENRVTTKGKSSKSASKPKKSSPTKNVDSESKVRGGNKRGNKDKKKKAEKQPEKISTLTKTDFVIQPIEGLVFPTHQVRLGKILRPLDQLPKGLVLSLVPKQSNPGDQTIFRAQLAESSTTSWELIQASSNTVYFNIDFEGNDDETHILCMGSESSKDNTIAEAIPRDYLLRVCQGDKIVKDIVMLSTQQSIPVIPIPLNSTSSSPATLENAPKGPLTWRFTQETIASLERQLSNKSEQTGIQVTPELTTEQKITFNFETPEESPNIFRFTNSISLHLEGNSCFWKVEYRKNDYAELPEGINVLNLVTKFRNKVRKTRGVWRENYKISLIPAVGEDLASDIVNSRDRSEEVRKARVFFKLALDGTEDNPDVKRLIKFYDKQDEINEVLSELKSPVELKNTFEGLSLPTKRLFEGEQATETRNLVIQINRQ